MKVRTWAVPASLALLLSACVVATPQDDGPRHHHQQRYDNDVQDQGNEPAPRHERRGERRASVERFSCENGLSVQVRNLSTNQVELRLDDKVATLSSAVAGSGERYVANQGLFGKGAEWHQKGSEAFFGFTDPYGNKVETSCSAR